MYNKLILWGWLIVLLFTSQVHAQTYSVATEEDDFIARVLFDAFAHEYHFDVRFNRLPSHKAILQSVKTGESDFAVNITYSAERAKQFDFSVPINVEPTYLFSPHSQAHLEDIQVVGVPENAAFIDKIKHHYPNIELRSYEGISGARQLLAQGKVDAVIDVFSKLKPLLNDGLHATSLNHQLLIAPGSIITGKGRNQAILNKIEAFALTDDMQRQLRDAVKRYEFQLRRQALRRRVISSGFNPQHKLKVKLESQPRYVIYHSTGQVSGMSADILSKVCDALLLPCEIISNKDETWSNMFSDVMSDNIDIIGPIVVSERRKKSVYFSESYYHPHAYMIKRFGYKDGAYQDISQLVAERIGVIKDDFFQELLHEKLPNKTLIEFDSQKDMINGLLRHEVDYIVMNKINYSYALGQTPKMMPLTIDKVIGSIYQNDIAFGFPKTPKGAVLANLFSDALNIIDTNEIVRQYDIQPGWRSIFVIRNHYQQRIKIMTGIIIIILIAFFLYIRWSAMTDTLTGLYGRRSLFHRFKNGVPARLCFAKVYIGNMKAINQKYGIEIGDKALKELAKHVKRQWRGKVYRLNSTSFICVGRRADESVSARFEKMKGLVYIDLKRGVNVTYSLDITTSTHRERDMALYEVLKLMNQQRKMR